jgi:hypothetical protein
MREDHLASRLLMVRLLPLSLMLRLSVGISP